MQYNVNVKQFLFRRVIVFEEGSCTKIYNEAKRLRRGTNFEKSRGRNGKEENKEKRENKRQEKQINNEKNDQDKRGRNR